MSILDKIGTLLGNKKHSGYSFYSEGFGLRFESSEHCQCKQGKGNPLVQHQYILLQMLRENNAAEELRNGFLLASENAVCLDETERLLLDLPSAWSGSFEAEYQGQSFNADFSFQVKLIRPDGRKVHAYHFEDPYIRIGEKEYYLPTAEQYSVFKAIHEHQENKEKSEKNNLTLIYTVQQAQQQGLNIDLKHFMTTPVLKPKRVGISTVEQNDGSLRLIPELGADLSPEAIEQRLGQLEGQQSASLRVGEKIVLLDEERLAGIQEILSCRTISNKDKEQFFKTPTAFLDAALVDLETGFAMRVHGVTEFQKAYFGEGEGRALSWYGDEVETSNIPLRIHEAAVLIEPIEKLEEFCSLAEKTFEAGESVFNFEESLVFLPESKEEFIAALEDVKTQVGRREEQHSCSKSEKQDTIALTVDIQLNDETVDEGVSADNARTLPAFTGGLCQNEFTYSFFDYQEEGVRWLAAHIQKALTKSQKNEYVGALLADDMGLGKTFMTLAALRLYQKMLPDSAVKKPFLVVAPVVLLENWKQEVEKVFKSNPFSDVVVLQSSADLIRFRQAGASREVYVDATQQEAMDGESGVRYSLKVGKLFGSARLDFPNRLVLTNYDTLRDYQISLCMVDWAMVIFDEAQEIKNPNALKSRAAKGLKADFRLAVTGTPVENSLKDFWSLFDTVSPSLLYSFQEFYKQFMKPILDAHEDEKAEKQMQIGQELRSLVGQNMLRRTKEESLSGLPAKYIHDGTKEAHLQKVMQGEQQARYDNIIASVIHAKQSDNPKQLKEILLPSLQKMRNISLHPGLYSPDLLYWGADKNELKNSLCLSGKLTIMLEILENIRAKNEKVIIFVINKVLQRFLSFALGKLYDLPISIINGDTKAVSSPSGYGQQSRMEIIKEFEARDGFGIICMSPLAAGVGLTVTGANHVIHLERHWNPAKEAQATDRVYRIGATKDVHVYIPILTHPKLVSFDMNLHTLLTRKIDLKDAVVCPCEITSSDFDSDAVFGGKE